MTADRFHAATDRAFAFTGEGFPFASLTTASTAIGAYLRHYAKKITGTERLIARNARDAVYNILCAKEAAQALGAHLCYPGCLSLERKRAAADSLGAWVRPPGMRVAHTQRRWKQWEDRVLLELNNSTAAAEELGRTEKSCHLRLWRLRTGKTPMPADPR